MRTLFNIACTVPLRTLRALKTLFIEFLVPLRALILYKTTDLQTIVRA